MSVHDGIYMSKLGCQLKLGLILMALVLNSAVAETSAIEVMRGMAGVYKHRFKNGIIGVGKAPMEADTPYESEDVVEIVPYDDTHIYIRADLQFYNGHTCGIAGMAGYEGGSFVFHDPENALDGGAPCTLKVTPSGDSIKITDRLTPDGAASCRQFCGMRGSLSSVSLPLKTRRQIRYMKRILASREYQKAIDDLKKYEAARVKPQ